MSQYSIGLVRYLNAAPFRYGLAESGRARWVDETPSRLLGLLQQGAVDAAIVPAFDVFAHTELRVLPSACIASRGPALSVKLFSHIPLRQAAIVALDASSHTAAALTRIILHAHASDPVFVQMEPDLEKMLSRADAALLIGDPCMQADGSGLLVTDLGAEWVSLTGLPFVFALWAARPGADCAALNSLVSEAKKKGLAQLHRIVTEESNRLGLDPDVCLTYLRDRMHYDLDAQARQGLERFRQLAAEQGLIADVGPVRFAVEEDS